MSDLRAWIVTGTRGTTITRQVYAYKGEAVMAAKGLMHDHESVVIQEALVTPIQ